MDRRGREARSQPAEEEPGRVGRENEGVEVALHGFHALPYAEGHDIEERHVERLARASPAGAQAVRGPLLAVGRREVHDVRACRQPLGDDGRVELDFGAQGPVEGVLGLEDGGGSMPPAQERRHLRRSVATMSSGSEAAS